MVRFKHAESLDTDFAASGVICYVIAGSGTTAGVSASIGWNAGDLFVRPSSVAPW